MSKLFYYCESQPGGMGSWEVTSEDDLECLYGWYSEDCISADRKLVDWMATAEVGDMVDHRLGLLFRLKDNE